MSKLKDVVIAQTGVKEEKHTHWLLKVRTADSKLYQKEVLIGHVDGISSELRTLANYINLMASALEKGDK